MVEQRILVVDDDRTTARVIQLQLQKMGYPAVSIAKSASLAIQDVSKHAPDLVLMDINLGKGMDGIDAADIISKDHKTPVIFVTAYADEKTLARAKLTNPYGYINKPLRETDLRTTIALAFERAQAANETDVSTTNTLPLKDRMQMVLDEHGDIIRVSPPLKRFLRHLQLENMEDLLPEGSCRYATSARLSKKPQRVHGRLQDRMLSWEYRALGKANNVRLSIADITEHRQLSDHSIQEATLSEALDNLATGVIFINENLKIFYLNKSARQLLDRENVLQRNNDHLSCGTAGDTAALHKCVLEDRPRTLSLEREHDQAPLRILATPLTLREANYGHDLPIAIIYTFETVNSLERIEDVLCSFYHLSPAEAKIVSRLILTPHLEEVSSALGITLNTARTHMKRIYNKTNARGMSALLNMIVTGPAGTLIHSDN